MPRHGEVVLSLTRLNQLGAVDHEASSGHGRCRGHPAAGGRRRPGLGPGGSSSPAGGSATCWRSGGDPGLRAAQRCASGRCARSCGVSRPSSRTAPSRSHLAGLVKDNTGYDYPSLLAGSEGTQSVVTAARLRLVPRLRDTVTARARARRSRPAARAGPSGGQSGVPVSHSAEFFTTDRPRHTRRATPVLPTGPVPAQAYLLLEASLPGALDNLADVIVTARPPSGSRAAERGRRVWKLRWSGHPGGGRVPGVPIKLDVWAPAAQRVRLGRGWRPWSPRWTREPKSLPSVTSPTATRT